VNARAASLMPSEMVRYGHQTHLPLLDPHAACDGINASGDGVASIGSEPVHAANLAGAFFGNDLDDSAGVVVDECSRNQVKRNGTRSVRKLGGLDQRLKLTRDSHILRVYLAYFAAGRRLDRAA